MRFCERLTTALISATAIVMVQPYIAVALTPNQVNEIAKGITVLIDGQYPGSGIIIARKKNTYYVLTAAHVVATEDKYEVVTFDNRRYAVNYGTVRKLPGIDLAVLNFSSNQSYSISQLGNSEQVSEGSTVYTSGWANPGSQIRQRVRQFTSGQVSARPPKALADGYDLVYTNITRAGMSGGPVLDENGRLVGIHGRTEGDASSQGEIAVNGKVGFNLGIPINTFVSVAKKAAIDLGLQTTYSAPVLQTPSSSFLPTTTSTGRPKVIPGSGGASADACPGRHC
ncbi:putative protease [Tolypothrix sp. NIES-4075]|uniref:S1 family peptidase n=1 Tax=Tolypothrix sp. NIES-4075 TaxID=2005459 RepID=UPI000B5C5085|nr:serine protease [Tolypothrix sp. NIES-4075]GAX42010.1 putative protease [Tolypothrix sp. NIES-4075]